YHRARGYRLRKNPPPIAYRSPELQKDRALSSDLRWTPNAGHRASICALMASTKREMSEPVLKALSEAGKGPEKVLRAAEVPQNTSPVLNPEKPRHFRRHKLIAVALPTSFERPSM
ncbi:MAG: hypothetical protein ABDH91_09095, partial [Bacteroidia bacterium]